MEFTSYSKCSCGAITLYGEDSQSAYSCDAKKLKKYFPNLDLRSLKSGCLQDTYCCDHCVNHFGLDLCGCGSGKKLGKCENNLIECKKPMQVFGEYTRVIGRGAFC